MKRILALFLVMMSIVLPSIAQNSQERSKLKVIELDLRAGTQKPTMLRAPMRISVEAYYNIECNTIDIVYEGCSDGEVTLYLNDNIIQ